MAFQICILASLVAAALAGYSGDGAMAYGSYSNQLMKSDPYSMPQDKMYSNYLMDGTSMHNSAGMYRSYMPVSARMEGQNVYPGYQKHSSNHAVMSSQLTGRYTSTPTTMQGGQHYAQMAGHPHMQSTPMSYGNGAQMGHNNYGMDMSKAAQGYAHSSALVSSARPMMSGYQNYQHGFGAGHMMMMNNGHYSHHMPTSYVSFNGNEGNYRW